MDLIEMTPEECKFKKIAKRRIHQQEKDRQQNLAMANDIDHQAMTEGTEQFLGLCGKSEMQIQIKGIYNQDTKDEQPVSCIEFAIW